MATATSLASYPKPQPAPQKCRQTLAVRIHRGEVARTLDELCALGLVEKFRDEFNIVRYRLTHPVSERA
jgi:hypothetical protein